MDRSLILYAFWAWTLAPFLVFLGVTRKRERRKEDWAVVAAFTISFMATTIQREMAQLGLANWIVVVLYPVPQVAVLAYGLMDRWPTWRPWITAMSISVSGTIAVIVAARDLMPAHPEMATLGAVSWIALWLAWARKDLGLMKWALVMAFGATLPAVVAYGRATSPAQEWTAYLAMQIPFAIGVLLACVALWRQYRVTHDRPDGELPPPFGLQVLRTLMTSAGRA